MTTPVRALDFLRDVDVRLSVELGRTEMKLKDVLALGPESLVTLDRMTDDLLDVLVNGKPVARGEIVSQNGRFGLRIVEMIGEGEPGGDGGDSDGDAPAMPGVGRF